MPIERLQWLLSSAMSQGLPSTVVYRPFLLQSAHILFSGCLTSSRSTLACFSDVALSCRTDILRRRCWWLGLRTPQVIRGSFDPFRFYVDRKTRPGT
jgi:hypothetical protein